MVSASILAPRERTLLGYCAPCSLLYSWPTASGLLRLARCPECGNPLGRAPQRLPEKATPAARGPIHDQERA